MAALSDTIFALSSGRLPAAIAVVRLSGPAVRSVLETIAGTLPQPRRMHYSRLRAPDGTPIDRALSVFFPGPHSETGEDCAEFHLHGGKTVVAALFSALGELGLRPAEPGEFSRRAFLNGKIDLVQAEALADLVAADTETQRRFAADNLEGRQSRLYAGWRQRLLHARAMIEAELDFSDESDVPGSVAGTVWADMAALRHEVERHIAGFRRATLLREGFLVVILGAPNAGKSSLLNAIAQRDVAIVSEEAGTTRDLLEVQLDLAGCKVRLVDTAGLREAGTSKVERIGMERARSRAVEADLVLHLIDLTDPNSADVPGGEKLRVGNKLDLLGENAPQNFDVLLSAQEGTGIERLLEMISERAEAAAGISGEVLPSRERHVGHLTEAVRQLEDALREGWPLELRAEALRLAGVALGRITGEIGVEEVLGAIFSTFCIGK